MRPRRPHSGSFRSERWWQGGCCNHAPRPVAAMNKLRIITIPSRWLERSQRMCLAPCIAATSAFRGYGVGTESEMGDGSHPEILLTKLHSWGFDKTWLLLPRLVSVSSRLCFCLCLSLCLSLCLIFLSFVDLIFSHFLWCFWLSHGLLGAFYLHTPVVFQSLLAILKLWFSIELVRIFSSVSTLFFASLLFFDSACWWWCSLLSWIDVWW